jgi:hypothetical protein
MQTVQRRIYYGKSVHGHISYVIKSDCSPLHCNDVDLLGNKLSGKWYCSYPEIRECNDPAMLLVHDTHIETVRVGDIGLGKSTYSI